MNIKSENLTVITFELNDEVGVLTVNRPDKLNALNKTVLNEMKDVLEEIYKDREFKIKALILTGAGDKAFIAGADIAAMKEMDSKQSRDFRRLGQQVTLLLESLRIPVIAAVNGFALGGGCEMSMGCDFIYATKSALFGQPEVKLGLIPGYGGTQRLPRYIGRQKAKELIYTGRNFTAQEAKEWGLVQALFDNKEELMAGCFKTITEMKNNSSLAIGVAKKAINQGVDRGLANGLTIELDEFSVVFQSEDKDEGTTAFMEKRKPQFVGR